MLLKNLSNENKILIFFQEKRSTATIKKGLLWQQRDKFFSQWKERYFILTPDYLQCFKKGTSRITEMGEFIYKVKHPRRLIMYYITNKNCFSKDNKMKIGERLKIVFKRTIK